MFLTDEAVEGPMDSTISASHARARARVVTVPTLSMVADGQRRRCSSARRSRLVVTPTYTVRGPNLTRYLYVFFVRDMC